MKNYAKKNKIEIFLKHLKEDKEYNEILKLFYINNGNEEQINYLSGEIKQMELFIKFLEELLNE